MSTTMLADARAEALFCTHLPATQSLTRAQATAAIREAVRANNGVHGCACRVAQEYGDHPYEAAVRMLWATQTVAALYPARADITWSQLAVAA